ncbi:hypothetical protein EGW08_023629 [Elysia chlorotica]|uniref:Uncharacterized protein n=1 Tax=Elysia chlorotica TaxID=188477 RepID=A0A3S1B059_ELYCH|nr:hypothetical protein EGW08_023629 [Elysia chlorotica]
MKQRSVHHTQSKSSNQSKGVKKSYRQFKRYKSNGNTVPNFPEGDSENTRVHHGEKSTPDSDTDVVIIEDSDDDNERRGKGIRRNNGKGKGKGKSKIFNRKMISSKQGYPVPPLLTVL